MDIANTEVAYTRTGPIVLGKISEKRIYLLGMPATTFPLTKLVSRRESTLPRINIQFHNPDPNMDAATRTNNIYGNDIIVSVIRMIIISITPPKHPAIKPRITPIIVDITVAANPTNKDILTAYSSLLNISLP